MRYRFLIPAAVVMAVAIQILPSVSCAQVPDPSMSSASATPGLIRAGWMELGPALHESLADQGHPITVTIRDVAGDPVPGVDPSRIALGFFPAGVDECAPLTADGPTNASGQTTISGHFAIAGSYSFDDDLVVFLDGTPLGGGPLELDVAQPDWETPGRIDLLDIRLLSVVSALASGGDYYPYWDLNRDGVNSLADHEALRSGGGASCPTVSSPYASVPRGTGRLYFDSAGTVTSQDLSVGDSFSISVFVEDLSLADVLAMEFSIPALVGPDIELLSVTWDAPVIEYQTDEESYFQVAFVGAPSVADRWRVATLHCVLQSPVVGLNLSLGGLPAPVSSFGPSPRPGWVTGSTVDVHDFVSTTGITINRVDGVPWAGMEFEGSGGSALTPMSDLLEITGLGSVEIGMGSSGGGGGSGSEGSYMEFPSDLPAANLGPGAFLKSTWEDQAGLPAVQLSADVVAGAFAMGLDLSGLNSGPPELVLRYQGQDIEQRPNYSGLWTAPEGLPDAQRLLYQDGEIEFWQRWDDGIQVTLDDQSVHLVDQISLRSNTGNAIPRDWLKSLRLEGDQLPAVQIGTAGLQRFDRVHIGAENLLYLSEPSTLVLVAVDPGTPARVSIVSTDGSQLLLPGYPPPWPPNAPATVEFRFEDSLDPQGPDVGLTLVDQGGDEYIEIDLADQVVSGYQITALSAGNVIDQYVATGSFVGLAQEWSAAHGMEGQEMVLKWSKKTEVDLTTSTNTAKRQGLVELDELRLLPIEPLDLPDGRRVTMIFTGTSRYAFTDDVLPTPAPEYRRVRTALEPNVPNPFNPSTTLSFTLGVAGPANLSIYDLRGRRITTLFDEWRDSGPGVAIWDGRDRFGNGVASGVYHAVLRCGGEVHARKVTLVK